MTRYFFHLFDHLDVRDEEGALFPNLAAAQLFAIDNARSIMKSDVNEGEICLSHRIEIEDEGGHTLMIVQFRDALLVLR